MSKISRSSIAIKSETGGEWFNEFLRICYDQKEVFNVIVGNKTESVSDVVKQYRDMVGLDLIKSENDEVAITKVAKATFLSIRHKVIKEASSPDVEHIKQVIDSFCKHSGGTKGIHSIINYLRENFGRDVIKFSDDELIKYIEESKKHYKHNIVENQSANDVGRVGIDKKDFYNDNIADYITHGK